MKNAAFNYNTSSAIDISLTQNFGNAMHRATNMQSSARVRLYTFTVCRNTKKCSKRRALQLNCVRT